MNFHVMKRERENELKEEINCDYFRCLQNKNNNKKKIYTYMRITRIYTLVCAMDDHE